MGCMWCEFPQATEITEVEVRPWGDPPQTTFKVEMTLCIECEKVFRENWLTSNALNLTNWISKRKEDIKNGK